MALVFVHAGYSPYLEFSLRQARAASPESEIILLGDASNDRFPFVRHVDLAAFPDARLGAAYRHRSTNGEAFERACFDRWLALDVLLSRDAMADALVLDSDVMLYATEAEIRRTHVGAAACALSRPEQPEPFAWSASPHASYWTAAALADFCAFLRASFDAPFAPYDDKWRHHVEAGIGGGVCDMTALYLWAEARPDVASLADVRGGAAFDHNLNVADNAVPAEYRTDAAGKVLSWTDGRPFGFSERLGAPVRFYGLHCQGHAKGRMPGFYTGPDFDGQAAARRAVVSANGLRRQASALVQPLRKLRSRLGL